MRDASFHLLDRAAWPRSEHFDYYIRTVKCRYDLTAHLTVTALRERGKALGLRFYPLLLYIAARAINANREFCMGFNEHGDVYKRQLLKDGGVSAFLCLSSLMRRLLGGPDRRCSAPPGALFGAFFWGVCPVIFSECSLKDGL